MGKMGEKFLESCVMGDAILGEEGLIVNPGVIGNRAFKGL